MDKYLFQKALRLIEDVQIKMAGDERLDNIPLKLKLEYLKDLGECIHWLKIAMAKEDEKLEGAVKIDREND